MSSRGGGIAKRQRRYFFNELLESRNFVDQKALTPKWESENMRDDLSNLKYDYQTSICAL